MDNFDVEIKEPDAVELEIQGLAEIPAEVYQSNYTENDPQAPSYIQNRPFYSETVTEPFEITWDGAWGGRQYVVALQSSSSGLVFVKVSDTVFDIEQLQNGYFTVQYHERNGDYSETYPVSEMETASADFDTGVAHMFMTSALPVFAVSTGDVTLEDGSPVEKGTYFAALRTLNSDGFVQSIFGSSLSFPTATFEKYHKLDNNYIDAEWMATESTGKGTKQYKVNETTDLFYLGWFNGATLFRLDSRHYTKEELIGARVTLYTDGSPVTAIVEDAVTYEELGGLVVAPVANPLLNDDDFVLLSSPNAILDTGSNGLLLSVSDDADVSAFESVTIEIFNAEGQSLPNKLPNKFLDLDWIPKAKTTADIIYQGTLKTGTGTISIGYDPQMLDPETVLLVTVDGSTREVRGENIYGAFVSFPIITSDDNDVSLIAIGAGGNTARLEFSVTQDTEITISIVNHVPNPVPSYLLPEGLGSSVIVNIGASLSDGMSGYEAEIQAAFNSGSRVVLNFQDATLYLLAYENTLDGPFGLACDSNGSFYRFSDMLGDGYLFYITSSSEPAVLYKERDSNTYSETMLHSTLKEGSTLPAQEGAVYAAIQGLQNTIGTLNQDLENRLNGGA